jgi:hypothetical protein
MCTSMLLAGNVAAVTTQKHYPATYFPHSAYCCKIATTAESSVGKKGNYYRSKVQPSMLQNEPRL